MELTKDEKNKLIDAGFQLLRPRFNHKTGKWDIAKRTQHCGWTVIISDFDMQNVCIDCINMMISFNGLIVLDI